MTEQSKIGGSDRVAASKHVRCRAFDDDLVMIDLEGGQYYALDRIGARMWDMLTSGKTPTETAAALVADYAASEDQILADCTSLANELLRRGLLVIRSP